MLRDTQDSLIISPRSVDQLVEAIHRILCDTDLARRMSVGMGFSDSGANFLGISPGMDMID